MTASGEPIGQPGPTQRFILVGDCCSGVPGGPHEADFAAIVAEMARVDPRPAFICFLGDHIMGQTRQETPSVETLRAQWRYWCDHEFAVFRQGDVDVYHLTSNHNTFDTVSEDVFREVFADLPRNGPAWDQGLSYYVTRDDLLLVFTNSASSRLGQGHVETKWLAEVLDRHRSIPRKIVFGHYPVLPVNGYTRYPDWRIEPRSGEAFWRLLADHGVLAYVCSHVIAFDMRARDGVLQICSAGAGTRHGPTGAFMRGPAQFFHFVVCDLDGKTLRCRAVDQHGTVRAGISWPPTGAEFGRQRIGPYALGPAVQTAAVPRPAALRFDLSLRRDHPTDGRETLVCGFDIDEGPPIVWIGFEGPRLIVELVLEPGGHVGRWVLNRAADQQQRFSIEIRPAMGPGGVMIAETDGRRTSFETSVADDLHRICWPESWRAGAGPIGPEDDPFAGHLEAIMAISNRSAGLTPG